MEMGDCGNECILLAADSRGLRWRYLRTPCALPGLRTNRLSCSISFCVNTGGTEWRDSVSGCWPTGLPYGWSTASPLARRVFCGFCSGWLRFQSPCYYFFRLFGSIRRYFLWHLRRRLILTYFFVAVVPIGLIVVLIGIAALILNGQFASYLVLSRLHERIDRLDQVGQVIARYADRSAKSSPEASLDDLEDFTASELAGQASYFPGLEITLRIGAAEQAFRLGDRATARPVVTPRWLSAERFSGIVLDGDQLASRAIARARIGPANSW